MNDLIVFDKPEEVKLLRLYLTRSGQGGYLIRVTQIPFEGEVKQLEKFYRGKTLGQMRPIVERLLLKLRSRGLEGRQFSMESSLIRSNHWG